ncbi:unnamed protein product [Porites evermanni]|uniref:G-protein coupled receptors family 1 profile domain-containing protein n=1 Tax=Porites evermanni TaxID=104178 RepID=A0ABN8T124_9CNID|nr:unnamed protein product [Porites evermanni]
MERYYAVVYPLGNKGKLTIRKLKLIIPGSWILAVIINIPEFIKQDFVEEQNPNYCIYDYDWPQKWMEKSFLLAGICIPMLCFTLMMG